MTDIHSDASGRDVRGPAFATGLEAHGDVIAIIAQDGERISYAELAAQADAAAQQMGPKGALVALEARNDVDALVAYLGALRSGHPLILTAAEADQEKIYEAFTPDTRIWRQESAWQVKVAEQVDLVAHPDLALLLSTSGTTGAAKLVRLSSQALNANAEAITDFLRITPDDRAITTLPISYSYGLSVINSHLAAGASIVLTDMSVTQPQFWRLFETNQVTSLAGVPYTYELLERSGFLDRTYPSLATLTQAGGRLPVESVRRFAEWSQAHRIRFHVMYGQTEAVARMAHLPPDLVLANPDAIGIAIPGGRLALRDEAGRPITQTDVEGELIYAGPNVMMGYATTRADLSHASQLTELVTGDLAKRDSNGLYRITGRKSRFAKIFGLRLGLDEIETALIVMGAPGIVASDDNVIVLGLEHSARRGDVSEELAKTYDLPASVFRVTYWDDPPRLPSGKPDYQTLLKAGLDQAGIGLDDDAPRDEILKGAFARAFPRRAVTLDDSFVGLGGDSLNYVALSIEIESAIGFLPDGWENLALRRLCSLSPRRSATTWPGFRWIDSEIVLRAIAVVCVVIVHASEWPVSGGAEVLLLLAGYSLARYQKQRLLDGRGFEVVGSFIVRIILPYYLLLISYLVAKHYLDVPSLFLVSNLFGRFQSLMEPYWFLEVLLQCLLVIAALFALKPVRTAVAADPWLAGLVFLAAALALKGLAHGSFHDPALGNRTPPVVLYLLALGWCMHEAIGSRSRRVLLTAITTGLGVLIIAGAGRYWPAETPQSMTSHLVWLGACTGGLLWMRRLAVPTMFHAVFSAVAAASFYIYLTHVAPVHLLHWQQRTSDTITVVGAAVALGLLTWWGTMKGSEALNRWVSHRRQIRA